MCGIRAGVCHSSEIEIAGLEDLGYWMHLYVVERVVWCPTDTEHWGIHDVYQVNMVQSERWV